MATVPPNVHKRSRETDDEGDETVIDPTLVGEEGAPKRKRGRPPGSGKKKDAPGVGGPSDAISPSVDGTSGDPTSATGDVPAPVKRGRGRPKKIKSPEEIAAEEAKKNRPPAKRGRPRKKPKTDEDTTAAAPVPEQTVETAAAVA